MPRFPIEQALLEKQERDGDFCQCGAIPDPDWEPHCFACGSYWDDVAKGIFDYE